MFDEQYKGAAERLTPEDLTLLCEQFGVGEAEASAFLEVEAAGSGFDSRGRPKMLFEPHVFYRNLRDPNLRDKAVEEGLAYPKWRSDNYPANSYPKLELAMELDEQAALQSASWGIGQILGENCHVCGYTSPMAMVRAFAESERAQVTAMLKFIEAKGILKALREHRWEDVARVYNGPGYAKHNYHTRLGEAYVRLARTEDLDASYPMLRFGDRGESVDQLQRRLNALGYRAGHVDGVLGAETRAAVLALQADRGIPTDGVVGPRTWSALNDPSAGVKPVAAERANAQMADLRAAGSRTVQMGDRGQVAGGGAALTGGVAALSQWLSSVPRDQIAPWLSGFQAVAKQFADMATANTPWLLLLAGGAVVYYVSQMKRARLGDHRSGKNLQR